MASLAELGQAGPAAFWNSYKLKEPEFYERPRIDIRKISFCGDYQL